MKWNGKLKNKFATTGHYEIRITDTSGVAPAVEIPIDIVRLGITEISARESEAGSDEWQMVYYLKGDEYEFFATPDIHEYLNVKGDGEISDLDRDDGKPRPIPAIHKQTDNPVLEGGCYENDVYNYPLCYLKSAVPRLRVKFGSTATTSTGTPMDTGYPLAKFEIRARLFLKGKLLSTSGPITPGGSVMLTGPQLPSTVKRVDRKLRFRWQFRETGAAAWSYVPGRLTIPQRFYTILGEPQFKQGASGIQYAGPWVEVAEYWHVWQKKQGIDAATMNDCVKNHVRGFFGRNAHIDSPIEGMRYDSWPLGGANGRTLYHNSTTWNMCLSSLLNKHAHGEFFNCTDTMGATSTMLAMMGARNVRPVRLSTMHLHNVWPVGAADYVMPIFGYHNSHWFGYHHVVTQDYGNRIIDTCIQSDEDRNPTMKPGFFGWNDGRLWSGKFGYNNMSSSNSPTRTVQLLPGLN